MIPSFIQLYVKSPIFSDGEVAISLVMGGKLTL